MQPGKKLGLLVKMQFRRRLGTKAKSVFRSLLFLGLICGEESGIVCETIHKINK